MWQTILIWLIIALCAFFIGRRFFRQWRSALSGKTVSCCLDSGCSCCPSATSCPTDHKEKQINAGS
ncbi:FeoB-associated Cys-rich membrane protein [Desulfofustis glycolicus]|uniref:Virus attachment protein p12 family protein n=1 Tax=Desulfofustis glycolicus DSM 9705 TaxID=1121409 RepID=A0A1M5W742_9BACT|nr:FeoB-associated Cys-rich membrane protein [Desulfofustis glycolicus]MCB2217296.1 FeoB-associated Cys-rich membrane protein [Desulfobulbaceae bacterium]SHH83291.1 Virus attachment protein p12 family protein [Desulfofustis glycolicus DSM 9705]